MLPRGTHQVSCLSEAAKPGDPEVGGKLAPDLVTQPQSELQIRETSADVPLRVILTVGIHLEFGLQNQALAEEQLILGAEARRGPAGVTHIPGGLDLEEVRCQAFNTEREPVP